jgi:hypothetical protein
MHRLLLAIALLMQLGILAQIDPKKRDSLAKSIDSSAKAYRSWQDSFTNAQDSIYHAAINKEVKNASRNPDQFLAEQKRKEAKERQQAIVRIIIGVALLAIGIIAIVKRRKTKT